MKVYFDKHETLVVEPETITEQMALTLWNLKSGEKLFEGESYVRTGRLVVLTTVAPTP